MSIDYTHDYTNHTLLDNKPHYSKIFKLDEIEASDVHRGDLIVLKTPCGQYRLYLALDDADEDNTLHLSRYSEIEFAKAEPNNNDLVISASGGPCGYDFYEGDTDTDINNGSGSCGC